MLDEEDQSKKEIRVDPDERKTDWDENCGIGGMTRIDVLPPRVWPQRRDTHGRRILQKVL